MATRDQPYPKFQDRIRSGQGYKARINKRYVNIAESFGLKKTENH